MYILPAIDIKDGDCVRLVQGDYNTAYKVAKDALETAKAFRTAGAQWLHMVDLDGAKDARPRNADLILRVAKESGLQVELGGGIRTMDTIDYYLNNGISRVILGSAALRNPKLVQDAVEKYAERIAVGIDARDGIVAAEGWLETSEVNYLDLAREMEQIGVKTLIFTDISCDGTLSGPNLSMLDQLNTAVNCDILASGGVSTAKDILNLLDLGVKGVICGKAIYAGTLDLGQAIELCRRANTVEE